MKGAKEQNRDVRHFNTAWIEFRDFVEFYTFSHMIAISHRPKFGQVAHNLNRIKAFFLREEILHNGTNFA